MPRMDVDKKKSKQNYTDKRSISKPIKMLLILRVKELHRLRKRLKHIKEVKR